MIPSNTGIAEVAECVEDISISKKGGFKMNNNNSSQPNNNGGGGNGFSSIINQLVQKVSSFINNNSNSNSSSTFNNSGAGGGNGIVSILKLVAKGFGCIILIYFFIQFFKNLFQVMKTGAHSLSNFISELFSSFVNALIALLHLPFQLVDSLINFLFH